MRVSDPIAFIRDNLPVTPVPGIPEIRLHKAAPSSGLRRLAAQDEGRFGSPYWAYFWAGGLALARYVLDHPGAVAGRRVLDLGAGSGLVAIAAAKAGADRVTAADVDPYAVTAMELNMRLNGVTLSIVHGDLTAGAPPDADLILIGDLFYAEDLAERVTAFAGRCLEHGIDVLIGDPWRAHLPMSRLEELARYDVVETGAVRPGGVFAFTG